MNHKLKLKFNKRVKVLPFLWLNFGMKGLNSVSLGTKGLTITANTKAVNLTVSGTGTGLSVKKELWKAK